MECKIDLLDVLDNSYFKNVDEAVNFLFNTESNIIKVTIQDKVVSDVYPINHPNMELIGIITFNSDKLRLNLVENSEEFGPNIMLVENVDVVKSWYKEVGDEVYIIYSVPVDPQVHFTVYTYILNKLEFEIAKEYLRLNKDKSKRYKLAYDKILNIKSI